MKMVLNYNFEWDSTKAKSNVAKHKIYFEEAVSVFRDENAITIFDDEHSQDENRWITIGMNASTKTLVVVHTWIEQSGETINIRIISARKATKNEQKIYRGV